MKIILRNIVLILLCFITLSIKVFAYEIKKLGLENGLSNNNIVGFSQDKNGYIWICTKDGLNRFDGNTFKIFRHSKTNSNSICSNVLNCVYADKFDDIIWIATEKNGIDAYNYRTNTFVHYESDNTGHNPNALNANGVTHITPDNKGNLWIATYLGGIDYFDKKTGIFTHYNQSNVKGLVSNYNWYVLYDSEDRIYIGHVTDGLSILNPKTRIAVNFKHQADNPSSLPDNTVTCIFKDTRNNIWIGTRNGLCLFDPVTAKMIIFKNERDNPYSLSNSFIQSIVEDEKSRLWIGTEGGGVNILDLKENFYISNLKSAKFIRLPICDTPDGLSGSSVQDIFIDRFNNIWIGGLGGGINFIPENESFFNKLIYLPIPENTNSLNGKVVPGMCVDNENNLWVANLSGGICIYRDNKKIKQFRNNSALSSYNITYVYRDRNSNIWASTDNGKLFQYNIKKQIWIPFTNFEMINSIPIYHLFEDSRDNLWISTDIGLLMYNIKTTNTIFYTTHNSGIRDDNIRVVNEDTNGNIWVGTLGGGLGVFDKDFNRLYEFGSFFDFYSVKDIFKDSKGRIWVASQNDLFLFKDYDIKNVVRINENYGLIENDIRAIIEGKTADEIWFSTTNGISYLDVKNMKISNFTVNDGIARGDYIHYSKAKTPNGTIYFGSQNGISYFNQEIEKSANYFLKTVITSFLVTNNKQNLNELIDVLYKDTMILNYNQNTFQLHFNVMNYALSPKVEFAFQMRGLDDSWYFINQDKYVIFRNLKPGNYIFNLKTRLHNSDWSNNITSMHIKIKPPFWLSWWAKFIYLTFIVIIVYTIVRFYKNKITIEHELLFERKTREHEQKLNDERMKFFTNITHELRTPMTLILGPLEELISDNKIPPEQAKKLNSIHNVATRLLQLINQILEFRRSTNKSRKLKVIKNDFTKFIYEIGLKYYELAQKKNIEFKIDIPKDKIEMFFDSEVVSIIVDNLLSNSFKYTKEGNIILKVQNYIENNIDYTEIIVSDTGFGISEHDLPHIFERYYQARNTHYPVSGTGIGLAIVENMVELHEAEISVNSQINQGTTFKVKFLTKNSYPEAFHISPDEEKIEEILDVQSSKKVILIVDDNQEIIEYIKDCLSDTYIIYSAENGKMGFEVACDKMPDLVIADIMMPVMDGIEMTKNMKKDIRTSHIPVILLTAKGSFQDQKEGYDAGADSYLTKPFSGMLLKTKIKNILETRDKLRISYSSSFKEKQSLFVESLNKIDKEFLEKLDILIEKYLEDEELHISQIADELCMSHSTLYRKIKALTNLTANEYIRKVRIRVAERYLITGKYTISEIMYKVGINSSSYFRQCFKDEYGMNPSEYVQKLKKV
jgi:signal transduction histidine kinase/ligand-binding sensor domain-containing protein/AraC-like DNA-binding protein